MVRRTGQEEGERRPEGGEGCRAKHASQACLNKDRMARDHEEDVPQNAEVVHPRVSGGIVGHEEPQKNEDEILET